MTHVLVATGLFEYLARVALRLVRSDVRSALYPRRSGQSGRSTTGEISA